MTKATRSISITLFLFVFILLSAGGVRAFTSDPQGNVILTRIRGFVLSLDKDDAEDDVDGDDDVDGHKESDNMDDEEEIDEVDEMGNLLTSMESE